VYAAARESLAALQPADSGAWLRSAFSAIAGYAYARPFDETTFASLFELKRDSPPVLMPHVIPAAEIVRGHKRFRRNLEAMADLAAQRGVPLLFVVPQRNAESSFYLRFHIDPSEIWPGRIEAWRRSYDLGLKAKREGRFEDAVRLLEQVRRDYVEDRDDLLAFHLAECHAALGNATDSLREYALSIRRHPLIEILREVARAKRVPLVDPFEALVNEAGGGVPGYELFVDSVHPYPTACRTIARAILDGLVAQKVLEDVRAPEPARLAEVEARCAALARESTERNTPIHARIYGAIRRGDLAEAVRWGETRPRAELLLDPVDLFYYGWALTLAGRLDEAHALYDESRALYVGADTRLPDLSTPEAMIEVAFNGDVFAFF
jgi:tetratricopeptide (TPR) repeat protein